MWNGFKAQLLNEEDVDSSKISIILNHILKVWCNNNREYYVYMLNWFKSIFIRLTKK